MKKIYIFMLLLLSAVSCRLDDGSTTHRTEGSVTRHTAGLFYDIVINSVDFLDQALVLDAFLKLPEEEQQSEKYEYLRHELKRYDETTYVLGSKVISTAGTSLSDQGSVWTVELDTDHLVYYMYHNYYITAGGASPENSVVRWTLTCTGTDSWDISMGDESSVVFNASLSGTVAELQEGCAYFGSGYDYEVTIDGKIAEDSEGFSGVFVSDDFRYFYKRYESDGQDEDNTDWYSRSYTSTFRLDIYKWGQQRDWCIQYTTEDGTEYLTSVTGDLPL